MLLALDQSEMGNQRLLRQLRTPEGWGLLQSLWNVKREGDSKKKKNFKGKMGLNKTKRNFCEDEKQKAEDLQGKSGGLDTQIGSGCFPKEGLAGERRKQRLHVVRGPHFLWPASSLQPNP